MEKSIIGKVDYEFMTIVQKLRNKIKEFNSVSRKMNLFDPNINDKSTHLLKFRDHKNNTFEIWIFTDRIKLVTPMATSLLFSINFSDKVCFANKLLEEVIGIGKVFTDNSQDHQIKLCIKLLMNELKSFRFDTTEGLTVYRNLLQLTLKNDRQLLPEIDTCIKIRSLIELNYPEIIHKIDYSDMPADLKNLKDKFESWV